MKASSASTQLNFNATQPNSELGTTQLKLVVYCVVVVYVEVVVLSIAAGYFVFSCC